MTDNETLNNSLRARGFSQAPAVPYADAMTTLMKRVERIELANIANAGIRLKEQEFLATVKERIDALEHRADRIYPLGMPPSERDRQADWKRTFNAVLPEAISTTYNRFAGTAENQAAAIDYASNFADRAHGPLEAKAIDVDKRLTELQDEAVFKRSEVEALVKAARVALPMMAGLDAHYGSRESGEAIDALADAVKVFEQSCPLVGCERAMPHVHEVSGPFEAKP